MLSLIFLISFIATDNPQNNTAAKEVSEPGIALNLTVPRKKISFEIPYRELSVSRDLDLFLAKANVSWTQKDKEDVIDTLLEIESKYGYRPRLFLKLMQVESNFRINAVSKDGAMGLCQIQPDTAKNISTKMGSPAVPSELLFDPVINLRLSAQYLSFLENRYKALPKAISAYNMGPGTFSRIYGEGGIPQGRYHDLLSED